MSNIGGALLAGNSKLFEGPLGVVQLGFKGFDLGKTTADTNLTPDQDIKDILFQQDGTKPSDHVRTGQDMILACTFGKISTGLLKLLMAGVSSENESSSDDSGTIGRSIYQSMRDNEAGVLKINAVDENGEPSASLQDIINCYEAIPIVTGELINWGADTQRNFAMEFRIKFHVFAEGESTAKYGAFGYWGDPTNEDVPAIVWPDVEAPVIVTAIATSATELAVTFDENIAFQTSFDVAHYMAKVEGEYVPPVSAIIASALITLTFGASTFTAGDVIELSISAIALEDTETAANAYPGVDAQPVTNSV